MKKLLIILALASAAWGAQKYCTFNAGAGDGSIGSPWNSIAACNTNSSDLDTINCQGKDTITGITYWDHSSRRAILRQWSGQPKAELYFSGDNDGEIRVQGSKLIINNFWFSTGSRSEPSDIIRFYVGTDSSEINNCKFYDYNGECVDARSRYFKFINDTITNGTGHGVYCEGAQAIVRNCYFKDLALNTGMARQCDCVILINDSCLIEGNYFESNSVKSDVLIVDAGSNRSGHIVRNNWFNGINMVSGIDCDFSNVGKLTKSKFINNVFTNKHQSTNDESYAGLRFTSIKCDDSNTVIVANNSFYLTGDARLQNIFKSALMFYNINNNSNGFVTVKNNAIYTNEIRDSIVIYPIGSKDSLAKITSSNNILYNSNTGNKASFFGNKGRYQYSASDDTTHNPLFVSSTNLYPQSSSPMIGAGATLSSLFSWGINNGATWPNPDTLTRAAPWDIGAYKYGAAAASKKFIGTIVR